MRRRLADRLVQELADLGVKAYVVPGKKHDRVVFERGGRRWTYFTASTPSDLRAEANARAGVRRLLKQACSGTPP